MILVNTGCFWTENIKLLDKFEEGDIIKINDVEVKQGFRETRPI